MSALEEYRKLADDRQWLIIDDIFDKADAAIDELEALVNANTDHMTEVGVELCREREARIDELEAALADLAEAGPEGRSRERKAYLGWRERAEQERRQRVQWTEVALKAEANAQHWAESSKKFHDLADDWRMAFKGEEMRAEEAEAERDRLEKENREMFRQLLGAGETFNKMNAELRELQSNGKAP